MKEYALSEVFHHPESEILNNDVTEPVSLKNGPRETNFKSAPASSSLSSNGVEIKEETNGIIDYVPFVPEKKKSSSRDKKRKLKKFRKFLPFSRSYFQHKTSKLNAVLLFAFVKNVLQFTIHVVYLCNLYHTSTYPNHPLFTYVELKYVSTKCDR